MLSCTLCVILVFVSGCHFREESSTSLEDNSISLSSSDVRLNDSDDETLSKREPLIREETKDDNDGNEQSESSASQIPSETSEGTTNSQVVPSEPPFTPNKNTTENSQEYQVMERNAEALEKYLRDNLSPNDHGGIYLEKWGLGNDGGIFLYVWTMDASALNSILAAYTGEPFPVERLNARCSLAQLLQFSAALNDMKVSEGAYIVHTLSETSNLVTITVSENDFECICSEIEQIANHLHIPDECVIISKVRSENPVT